MNSFDGITREYTAWPLSRGAAVFSCVVIAAACAALLVVRPSMDWIIALIEAVALGTAGAISAMALYEKYTFRYTITGGRITDCSSNTAITIHEIEDIRSQRHFRSFVTYYQVQASGRSIVFSSDMRENGLHRGQSIIEAILGARSDLKVREARFAARRTGLSLLLAAAAGFLAPALAVMLAASPAGRRYAAGRYFSDRVDRARVEVLTYRYAIHDDCPGTRGGTIYVKAGASGRVRRELAAALRQAGEDGFFLLLYAYGDDISAGGRLPETLSFASGTELLFVDEHAYVQGSMRLAAGEELSTVRAEGPVRGILAAPQGVLRRLCWLGKRELPIGYEIFALASLAGYDM